MLVALVTRFANCIAQGNGNGKGFGHYGDGEMGGAGYRATRRCTGLAAGPPSYVELILEVSEDPVPVGWRVAENLSFPAHDQRGGMGGVFDPVVHWLLAVLSAEVDYADRCDISVV